MRRAVLLVLAVALCAALPAAAAPAAGKPCAKRHACVGKLAAKGRKGMPLDWTRRGGPARPGHTVPGGTQPGTTTPRPGAGGDAPPPPPPPPPPPEDPRYVQVVSDDSGVDGWTLTLSRTSVLAGIVSVEFNNRFAEDPHDLWLRKTGTTHKFDAVDAGAAATRALPLGAGTWKLWCQIGDHEARGMVANLTVVAG